MASTEARSLDQPDETRTPDKTKVDIVRLGDNEVGRFTFAPGWARPGTRPTAIGSPLIMTIGTVPVACLAARLAGVPQATMAATGR